MRKSDNAETEFDLNLLRTVVALYEERSVTGAARRLGLTQSSASRALAKLRDTFGDPLFIRTGSGIKPTPRADLLVDSARRVLTCVRQDVFVDRSFNPLESSTVFTFALHELSELVFYPKLIACLHSVSPKSRIRAVYPSLSDIVRGLELGEIDIAIGPSHAEFQRNSLLKQAVFDYKFVCLLRSDHPVKGSCLSVQQFCSLGHIKITPDHESIERAHILPKGMRYSISASHYLCLPTIIQACDAVATVPVVFATYLANAHPNLKVVEAPFSKVPVRCYQFWHSRFHNDPRNQWIRKMVKGALSVDFPSLTFLPRET